MKVLITGSNEQLGIELRAMAVNYPNYDFIFLGIEELENCNHNDVQKFINKNNINELINCVIYTAVDKVEPKYIIWLIKK